MVSEEKEEWIITLARQSIPTVNSIDEYCTCNVWTQELTNVFNQITFCGKAGIGRLGTHVHPPFREKCALSYVVCQEKEMGNCSVLFFSYEKQKDQAP